MAEILLSEFDKKLISKMNDYKRDSGKPLYQIADEAGIERHTIYNFNTMQRALMPENTMKLMDYLNLTVNLEEK